MSLLNDLSALALAPLLRTLDDDALDGADHLRMIGWLLVHAGTADFPLREALLDASCLAWQVVECVLAAPLMAHASREEDSPAVKEVLQRLVAGLRAIGADRPARLVQDPSPLLVELRRARQARLLTASSGERSEMLPGLLRLCGCRSEQAWKFAEDDLISRLLEHLSPEYPLLASWLAHRESEGVRLVVLAMRLHLRRLILAMPQLHPLLAPPPEATDEPQRSRFTSLVVALQAEHRELIDRFLSRLSIQDNRAAPPTSPGSGGPCPRCGWRAAHAHPSEDVRIPVEEGDIRLEDGKDIFEETNFDVPGLEDESSAEAVALDEPDTDLEGSDFEISLEDDSDPNLTLSESIGAPGTGARDLRRRASIRWYRRMNPERMYPLTVVLSRGRVKEVRVEGVAQAVSAQQLVVSASQPFVVVRPVLPGIECYPPQQTVDVTPDTVTVRFRVLPKMLGTVEDSRIEFYARDRLLSEVPVDIKVSRQTAALVVSVAGFVWPLLGTAAQKLGMEVSDSQDLLAKGLREFLALPHAIEVGFGILLLSALVLYWLNRPRQAGADTDVLAVRPMSLAELLTAGRLAAAKKQWEEAASYFEDAVNVAPADPTAQAELRAVRPVLAKRRAMSGA